MSLRKFFLKGESISPYEKSILIHGAIWFFLILCSYYVLRPIREQIGSTYGLKNLSWLFWATFGVMLVAIPLYSVMVGKFNRKILVPSIYAIFISALVYFWLAMSRQNLSAESEKWIACQLFVFVSAFGLFVVSFFWSVAGDMLSTKQGRRFFGIMMGAGTIGGIVGSQLAARLSSSIGVSNLLLIPCGLLFVATLVYLSMERSHTRLAPPKDESTSGKATGGNPFAGFTAVIKSRYLFLILLFGALLALCGTSVYFQQSEIVKKAFANTSFDESQINSVASSLQSAANESETDTVLAFSEYQTKARDQLQNEASKAARTSYFADVNSAVSIVTLIFQFLVAGFLMRTIGLGWTLAMLPIFYIFAVIALAVSPTLAVIAIASTIGRSAEYGLCNPAREVLFAAVNREDRYKAKSFIDTVVRRGGDSAAGSIYKALREEANVNMSILSWAIIPFAAAWVAVSVLIGRQNNKLQSESNKN